MNSRPRRQGVATYENEVSLPTEPEADIKGATPANRREHLSWADGPSASEVSEFGEPDGRASAAGGATLRGKTPEPDEVTDLVLDENAGLADRSGLPAKPPKSVKTGEGRTRASLYRALSLAYDFAIAAQQNPEEYAELLEESGVKAQARAPMTPVVKLVFGIDYDKARLTEFAAALSYGAAPENRARRVQRFHREAVGRAKALVAAERQARRRKHPDTKGDAARAKLRSARSISLADVPADEEFAVVLDAPSADGVHEPVAIVADEALIERAIRRAA